MPVTLTADQQVTAHAKFVDKYGNSVASPGGVPGWSVDHPELVTSTPAADGLSSLLVTVGPIGVATVTVTLGTLVGSDTVTVTPGVLSSTSISFDAPVAKGP